MAVFCCTPVWQLPFVSIVSILSYWKLPEGGFFYTWAAFLFFQITLHQLLQQLIAVDAAYQRAGVVVVGDVGGVLGQDIAHDLVDGVVALDLQRIVHR